MARLDDEDKEWLGLMVRETVSHAVRTEVQPLSDKQKEHDFILSGVDGTNGLRGDMKVAKGQLEELRFWKTKVVAYASTVGVLAGGLADYVKHRLNGG